MHLSLWKVLKGKSTKQVEEDEDKDGIVIEIQRRNGDSIIFHKYSRCILDAAAGDLDVKEYVVDQTSPDEKEELIDLVYNSSKKMLPPIRRLSFDSIKLNDEKDDDTSASSEEETAIRAIEIAKGLLSKDRIDANRLGFESLCLLTDTTKTSIEIATIVSRAVLLGTTSVTTTTTSTAAPEEEGELPFQKIRKTILALIRLDDQPQDEEEDFGDVDDEEHLAVLRNLALTVLSNALSVTEKEETSSSSTTSSNFAPEEVHCQEQSSSSSSRSTTIALFERFLREVDNNTNDGQQRCCLMKTLANELKDGVTTTRPHDAYLAVKCLGSLCRCSENARSQAKQLGGAEIIAHAAMEIGSQTHYKLERACQSYILSN
jgi:hypothetical protein